MHRYRWSRKERISSGLYSGIEDYQFGYVRSIVRDLDCDPNLLVPEHGISPLHLAIGHENKTFARNVTQLLLEHGGDPNVRSVDGMTPVHIAAAWGRTELLEMLLMEGGDPWLEDDEWKNAFQYAFEERRWRAAKLLEKCRTIDPRYSFMPDKVFYSREYRGESLPAPDTENCYRAVATQTSSCRSSSVQTFPQRLSSVATQTKPRCLSSIATQTFPHRLSTAASVEDLEHDATVKTPTFQHRLSRVASVDVLEHDATVVTQTFPHCLSSITSGEVLEHDRTVKTETFHCLSTVTSDDVFEDDPTVVTHTLPQRSSSITSVEDLEHDRTVKTQTFHCLSTVASEDVFEDDPTVVKQKLPHRSSSITSVEVLDLCDNVLHVKDTEVNELNLMTEIAVAALRNSDLPTFVPDGDLENEDLIDVATGLADVSFRCQDESSVTSEIDVGENLPSNCLAPSQVLPSPCGVCEIATLRHVARENLPSNCLVTSQVLPSPCGVCEIAKVLPLPCGKCGLAKLRHVARPNRAPHVTDKTSTKVTGGSHVSDATIDDVNRQQTSETVNVHEQPADQGHMASTDGSDAYETADEDHDEERQAPVSTSSKTHPTPSSSLSRVPDEIQLVDMKQSHYALLDEMQKHFEMQPPFALRRTDDDMKHNYAGPQHDETQQIGDTQQIDEKQQLLDVQQTASVKCVHRKTLEVFARRVINRFSWSRYENLPTQT